MRICLIVYMAFICVFGYLRAQRRYLGTIEVLTTHLYTNHTD